MAGVASSSSRPSALSISPENLGIPYATRNMYHIHLPDAVSSPVNFQQGHFEFDRIIKEGEVFKRTRKTKSWKAIYIILRPNVISFYRSERESTLRHKVNLPDVTAVARQKDPKGKDKYIFGVFTPSRNYHLAAHSDKEAQDWVETIRRESRLDDDEEEMLLASPGGANQNAYQGFGRSIDAHIGASPEERPGGYLSSSEADALSPVRTREGPGLPNPPRRPSYADYSGPERTSLSDLSDMAAPAARMSALSLSQTEPRPSTSSTQPPQLTAIYGQPPTRPSLSIRNPSQMSGIAHSASETQQAQDAQNDERVLHHSWIYLLKSKSGVRQWKKVWFVVRPKALALYKNEEEYSALLILPVSSVIDTVEIEPISKSKDLCMQLITDERNYKFCAFNEDSLVNCIGAIKSVLAKQKARRKEKEKERVAANADVPPVAVNP